MARRKHERKEFKGVSEISHASPDMKVQGVMMSSPIKKSKTCFYFNWEVTDGKVCIRVSDSLWGYAVQ